MTNLFSYSHNDLPWNIRKFMHNKIHGFNMSADLKVLRPWAKSSWSHTDLPRLKEGKVGAQVSSYLIIFIYLFNIGRDQAYMKLIAFQANG